MSLALAEILFKQSGESSLDKARDEHRHHGLSMTVGGTAKNADLKTASELIRAKPHESDGVRKGTFSLWHKSSREHPLAGELTTTLPSGGSTLQYHVVMGAIDTPYHDIPSNGLTLYDCFSALPLMLDHIEQTNVSTCLVRGKNISRVWSGANWRSEIDVIFHPSPLCLTIMETIKADPNDIDRIVIHEAGAGALVRLYSDYINGHVRMPLPPAATINTDEWRMWSNSPPLNEFGYIYVAIYLAGNYARYFPDKWLADVEASAPLGLAIEELCSLTEWRAPWLTFCELDRTLHVPEA